MIGDLVFDFLKKTLKDMVEDSFQRAPFILKLNFAEDFHDIAYFHTIPAWRDTGTGTFDDPGDQAEFNKLLAELVGQPPEEANRELHEKGKIVRARDANGKPVLEAGKQLWHLAGINVTSDEWNDWETEMFKRPTPPPPTPESDALKELRAKAEVLWQRPMKRHEP